MPPRSGELPLRQPAPATHLDGARANEKVSEALQLVSPGWAITALFYSAVHFMRAYLAAHHGVQIASHDAMHELWNRFPELRKVKVEYVHLKQTSEAFRYYLQDFDAQDVIDTRRHLAKVRGVLEPKIVRALAGGGDE